MGLEDRGYYKENYNKNINMTNELRTWRCPKCRNMSVRLKEKHYLCNRCGASYKVNDSYFE